MDAKSKILDDKIKAEKVTHDLGQESAKISALKSGNIDKYEYLTGQEVIPTGQAAALAHAKFEYSPLGKAFEKQVKTIKEQGEKQVKAIENSLVPIQERPKTDFSHLPPNQIRKAMEDRYREIQNLEGQIEGDLKYSEEHDLSGVMSGPVLIRELYLGNTSLHEAEAEQSKLLGKLSNLKKGRATKSDTIQRKERYKRDVGFRLDSREKVLNAFKSGLFPTKERGEKEVVTEMEKIISPTRESEDDPDVTIISDSEIEESDDKSWMTKLEGGPDSSKRQKFKDDDDDDDDEFLSPDEDSATQGEGFDLSSIMGGPFGLPSANKIKKLIEDKITGKGMKVMTPRQMLQRLPIAIAQVKAGNNSEELQNEIRQLLYSLYRANQISKKVYENLMKTI